MGSWAFSTVKDSLSTAPVPVACLLLWEPTAPPHRGGRCAGLGVCSLLLRLEGLCKRARGSLFQGSPMGRARNPEPFPGVSCALPCLPEVSQSEPLLTSHRQSAHCCYPCGQHPGPARPHDQRLSVWAGAGVAGLHCAVSCVMLPLAELLTPSRRCSDRVHSYPEFSVTSV